MGRSEAADTGRGSTLSAQDESILALERRLWRRVATKEEAIRSTLGLSPEVYYARLSALIDSDEAMAYDPLLVQRLQRRVASAS